MNGKIRLSIATVVALMGIVSMAEGSRIYLKAILAQMLLQNAWSQTLNGHEKSKPWSWADFYPVAKLAVPALNAETIVLAGANGGTLPFGPGHMASSASLGTDDNAVIVGHRDTHFKFLRDVTIDTLIVLTTPNGYRHSYTVEKTEVVHESAVHVLDPSGNKKLTLITCWPFDAVVPGGPLRYVVHAKAASNSFSSTL